MVLTGRGEMCCRSTINRRNPIATSLQPVYRQSTQSKRNPGVWLGVNSMQCGKFVLQHSVAGSLRYYRAASSWDVLFSTLVFAPPGILTTRTKPESALRSFALLESSVSVNGTSFPVRQDLPKRRQITAWLHPFPYRVYPPNFTHL